MNPVVHVCRNPRQLRQADIPDGEVGMLVFDPVSGSGFSGVVLYPQDLTPYAAWLAHSLLPLVDGDGFLVDEYNVDLRERRPRSLIHPLGYYVGQQSML